MKEIVKAIFDMILLEFKHFESGQTPIKIRLNRDKCIPVSASNESERQFKVVIKKEN